jgi:hypothetical protein
MEPPRAKRNPGGTMKKWCLPLYKPLLLRPKIMRSRQEDSGAMQWESVHECLKCGHVVKLGEIDLRVISTGMIACPNCEWSGPVRIEIVERKSPAE